MPPLWGVLAVPRQTRADLLGGAGCSAITLPEQIK
jgi:hypothetical protein